MTLGHDTGSDLMQTAPQGTDNAPLPEPGTEVTYRRLWPRDAAAIRAHFLRLSPDNRHSRFCGTVGDSVIDAYVDRIDWMQSVLIGGFDGDRLFAVGELLIPKRGWFRSAEASVSVEEAWQGHGFGDELLDMLLLAAQNRFLRSVELTCLGDNRAMTAMLTSHHATQRKESGMVVGVLRTGVPTALSLLREWALSVPRLLRWLAAPLRRALAH